MTASPDLAGGPERAMTLEEALAALEQGRATVARVRDHNDILTTQVMRLVEESRAYRRQLRTAAAALLDGMAGLAQLGEDCLRMSMYRVGVPKGAPVETGAATEPPVD